MPSHILELEVGKMFCDLNFYRKLWDLMKTKLRELSNTSPKIFHSQIFFELK